MPRSDVSPRRTSGDAILGSGHAGGRLEKPRASSRRGYRCSSSTSSEQRACSSAARTGGRGMPPTSERSRAAFSASRRCTPGRACVGPDSALPLARLAGTGRGCASCAAPCRRDEALSSGSRLALPRGQEHHASDGRFSVLGEGQGPWLGRAGGEGWVGSCRFFYLGIFASRVVGRVEWSTPDVEWARTDLVTASYGSKRVLSGGEGGRAGRPRAICRAASRRGGRAGGWAAGRWDGASAPSPSPGSSPRR